MFFRIVGVDLDVMRPASASEKMVPLRPILEQLAVGIDHQNAVLQARLALRRGLAERAVASRVTLGRLLRKRQFAALQNEDAVGRSPRRRRPAIPRSIPNAQRVRPIRRDVIRGRFHFRRPFPAPMRRSARWPWPSTIHRMLCLHVSRLSFHPPIRPALRRSGSALARRIAAKNANGPHPGPVVAVTLLHWHLIHVHT